MLNFTKYGFVVLVLAVLLRWTAIATEWELPSQLGTMLLFAPLQGCVVFVAWQPYLAARDSSIALFYRWLGSISTALFVFVLWNWVFHDGDLHRKSVEANAYHWATFFCVAWLGMRLMAFATWSGFSPRFRPHQVRVIDLLIGTALTAILLSCFRGVLDTNPVGIPAINKQLVHAVWGAALFAMLWGFLAFSLSIRDYRVWLFAGAILAITLARTLAPYTNAKVEGWIAGRNIVLIPTDTPPFKYRSGKIEFFTLLQNQRRIVVERHFIRFPMLHERLVEATVQVGTTIALIWIMTTSRAKADGVQPEMLLPEETRLDS